MEDLVKQYGDYLKLFDARMTDRLIIMDWSAT